MKSFFLHIPFIITQIPTKYLGYTDKRYLLSFFKLTMVFMILLSIDQISATNKYIINDLTVQNNRTDSASLTINGEIRDSLLLYPPFFDQSAIYFDGTDDYVEIERILPTSNECTISFWMKMEDNRTQIPFTTGATNSRFEFHYNWPKENSMTFYVATNNGINVAVDAYVPLSKWVHITGVWNKNEARIYINGTLINSKKISENATISSSKNIFLGKAPYDVNPQFFKGYIDDVRIYRIALNSSQISNLISGNIVNSSFLELYLSMDGTIQDLCGFETPLQAFVSQVNGISFLEFPLIINQNFTSSVIKINTSSGRFSLNLDLQSYSPGLYNITVANDYYDINGSNMLLFILDEVEIKLFCNDFRINVGRDPNIFWMGRYLYDGSVFDGKVILNDTTIKDTIGLNHYEVEGIIDNKYNLTTYKSNTLGIIYDQIHITLTTPSQRIDVGSIPEISVLGKYEYDESEFYGDVIVNNTNALNETGVFNYGVVDVLDYNYDLSTYEFNDISIIYDTILIYDGNVSSVKPIVGENVTIWVKAVYGYDYSEFNDSCGILYLNGKEMIWNNDEDKWELIISSDIKKEESYVITKIIDYQFFLTTYKQNIGLNVEWTGVNYIKVILRPKYVLFELFIILIVIFYTLIHYEKIQIRVIYE